jgi:cytochrome c oxidase cbb3-type subunit 4
MSAAVMSAWGHAVGALILVLMLSFIGIWLWAWLPYHNGNFEKLARMPMRDEDTRASGDQGAWQ